MENVIKMECYMFLIDTLLKEFLSLNEKGKLEEGWDGFFVHFLRGIVGRRGDVKLCAKVDDHHCCVCGVYIVRMCVCVCVFVYGCISMCLCVCVRK